MIIVRTVEVLGKTSDQPPVKITIQIDAGLSWNEQSEAKARLKTVALKILTALTIEGT